ncbi:MAG TPA: AraC family transcriptional regulator [Ignavibacteriaceae bacterium]|nr:AraC family transcriptional regulator [Ignavibacteriaceae bacterium]
MNSGASGAEKTLYIKNMVCPRCIKVVKEELEKLNLNVKNVQLGEAVIESEGEEINISKIKEVLQNNGFELLNDRQAKIIEKIKLRIIELIHHNANDQLLNENFSSYLSDKMNMSYQHLSSLFSSKEGITIEKYFINQKIEKVKELLIYDELTLSEISYKLGYSSVQHLSNQFKKVTGFTPSEFKKLKNKPRIPIDQVK